MLCLVIRCKCDLQYVILALLLGSKPVRVEFCAFCYVTRVIYVKPVLNFDTLICLSQM